MLIKTSSVEYFAAIYTFLWGVWALIGNSTTFDAMAFTILREGALSYAPNIPPHVTIGLFGILVGGLYFVAIYINGRGAMWTPFIRMGCAAANVIFFASISVGIASVDPLSPGVYTYAKIAIAFLIIFIWNFERTERALKIIGSKARWSSK